MALKTIRNCGNCGQLVPDTAERCPVCQTTDSTSESGAKATKPVIAHVSNHLASLGYTVGKLTAGDFLAATHENKAELRFRDFLGGLLFLTKFSGSENATIDRAGFLSYLNWINASAVLVRCFGDDNSNLIIGAWYPHRYDHEAFANFMERWESDIVSALMGDQSEAGRYLI